MTLTFSDFVACNGLRKHTSKNELVELGSKGLFRHTAMTVEETNYYTMPPHF